MNLCKCGDPRVVHVHATDECAMCECRTFVLRSVDTMSTPAKPRWMQRLTARDETGKVLGGIL